MADGITVTGLEETMQMLKDVPKTLIARGFVKALSDAAHVVPQELEVRAPVKAEDTGGILAKGELRESTTFAVELDSQLRGGVASVGFGKAGSIALWLAFRPELREMIRTAETAGHALIEKNITLVHEIIREPIRHFMTAYHIEQIRNLLPFCQLLDALFPLLEAAQIEAIRRGRFDGLDPAGRAN